MTALPHAFYPESPWRDDLELGAVELARAGFLLGDRRSSGWLTTAGHWARAYIRQEAGSDTLNLYDVSAIGHAEILSAARHHHGDLVVTRRRLLGDLRDQLAIGQRHAAKDPFRAGGNYDDFDVASHTFGLIATVKLLKLVTGTHRYDTFKTEQRNWVLGANPWGTTMVIGVGSQFPRCPQHVVANLSGGRDGTLPCCGVPSSTDPTRWTCSPTASASSSTMRPPARPTARMSTRSSPGAAASSSTTCGRG